jgi:hypothetical protein
VTSGRLRESKLQGRAARSCPLQEEAPGATATHRGLMDPLNLAREAGPL